MNMYGIIDQNEKLKNDFTNVSKMHRDEAILYFFYTGKGEVFCTSA